jgi:hypothetical protein
MRPARSVTVILASAAIILLSAVSHCSQEPDLGPPPGEYTVWSKDGTIRIPFEIFRDDILMTAEVNGKQLRMLIDNGSLWDQLLFFGSPRIDSLGLKMEDKIDVGGSGEGEPVRSDVASNVAIRFADVEFTGQTAIITPYSSGVTSLWEGADGQVSAAFFKHFVVGIDFDESIITLIKPGEFEYRGRGHMIPMEPAGYGSWTIPAQLDLADGSTRKVSLTLDLGDLHAMSLLTDTPNNIRLPAKALEASLGFGIQGEIRGHLGRVRSVRIGGYEVTDVLAAFTTSTDEPSLTNRDFIGFGLLSRFNIIFDYPHQRMFIEPNDRFGDPFEFSMSGMALRQGPDGNLVIVQIFPDSPASEAGLKRGDVITRVNGVDARRYKTWDLAPMLREEGKTVDFSVSSDGKELEVSITLRRLI